MDARPGRRRTTRWCRAGALALALAVAGCADSQDPGLDPGADAPTTTSHTLDACPPGGPDATTPPAGCIGGDGQVRKP